jgi:hypothetical protein
MRQNHIAYNNIVARDGSINIISKKGDIRGTGTISSDIISLNANHGTVFNGEMIESAKLVSIEANNIRNDGLIASDNKIILNARDSFNSGYKSRILSFGDIQITANKSISSYGFINSKDLTIKSFNGDIDNYSKIIGNRVNLNVAKGSINQHGSITANEFNVQGDYHEYTN